MDEALLDAVGLFVRAYTMKDSGMIGRLLADDVKYVSTSGEVSSGREKVVGMFQGSMNEYGKDAAYMAGLLDLTPVVLVLHKKGSRFERAVYKSFEMAGDKISGITASDEKKNLEKIQTL